MKFFSLFTATTLLFSTVVFSQTATAPSTGDGSSGTPYQIASLENLYWISQDDTRWDKHYIQTASIDASGSSSWDSNQGFTPIGTAGTEGTEFSGSYDGDGYTITGIYISRDASSMGLFGYTQGAEFKNMGLINVNVTSTLFGFACGALCGQLLGSSGDLASITDCYITGDASFATANSGSLVGVIGEYATVATSYSSVDIIGTGNEGGGLVGWVRSGTTPCTIRDCYYTGDLSGSTSMGGLIGRIESLATPTIENCYFSGTVTVSVHTEGALIGKVESSGIVKNCVYDSDVEGVGSLWGTGTPGTVTNCSGQSTSNMKDYTTYTALGWDFVTETDNGSDNYWDADQAGTVNNGYPILSWQSGADQSLPVTLSEFKAKYGKSGVSLSWITSTEVENLGFILYRSTHGNRSVVASFMDTDQLLGHGTTTEEHSYLYTDRKVFAGNSYEYILSDVDYSGKESIHTERAISLSIPSDKPIIADSYSLNSTFPNPFNPSFTIPFTLSTDMHVRATLYDVNGRQVMKVMDEDLNSGEYKHRVNSKIFSAGVYLLKMEFGTYSHTQKLVLLK